jgi:hypothetical protein
VETTGDEIDFICDEELQVRLKVRKMSISLNGIIIDDPGAQMRHVSESG